MIIYEYLISVSKRNVKLKSKTDLLPKSLIAEDKMGNLY